MKSNRRDLTTAPVGKTILSMTLPMIVGMLGIVLFNLVDTYFIGKIDPNSPTPLAAMGFTLPIVMLQGAISMGLGVGVAAVISKAIGEKDTLAVKRLTTDSLLLSFVIVLVSVTIGYLTINPLFKALGANKEQLLLIREYMEVWYIGIPFVVIPMVGNNAIRATGNTVIPSLIMLIAVVVNIVLDPIFIFGWGPIPRMELRGAAIATLIARCTTFVCSLLYLHFKLQMLTFSLPSAAEILSSWKKILYVSVPAALTQVLLPISMAVLTKTIATFGEDAVAAVGVANRIEMFALSPMMALGAVIIPFVGQNMGAKQKGRILNGITFSNKLALYFGTFLIALFVCCGHSIATLFHKEQSVITIVTQYVLIASFGYSSLSMNRISGSVFSALNLPHYAAAVNLLRLIVLFIPLILIGAHLWGLPGVMFGILLSSLLSGIISALWCTRTVKKLQI